ncbi:MAG: hypothetical protein ACLUL2_23080 [Blautia sp.]
MNFTSVFEEKGYTQKKPLSLASKDTKIKAFYAEKGDLCVWPCLAGIAMKL